MKQKSLAEALGRMDRSPAPAVAPQAEAKPPSQGQMSRHGKKMLGVYLDPAAIKQLHQLRLNTNRKTIGELVSEALNDLFERHKLSRIA